MSHDTDGQLVTFHCDVTGCDETFTASGQWKDVWESAKDDGWRAVNVDGEWEHRCPDHRGHR